MTHFYSKEESLTRLKDLAPDQLQAFNDFNMAVFKDSMLTRKEKEIIAVAITHVTQCPYCIDYHTKNAKRVGATLEELSEAVFVTAAVEAGGAVTHSTHIHNAKDTEASNSLYERSNLKSLGQLVKFSKEAFRGYQAFSTAATKDGKLSGKFKEIIAVAVATATQCPYCIDVHTKNAEKLGATNEELVEAVMVSSALRAGGAYAHMRIMMASFTD